MNVSLTRELEEFVAGKVETGMYNSASEVVREALRLLKTQDQLRALQLQDLRRELDKARESIERGEVVEYDSWEDAGEAIIAEGWRRYAERRR